MADLYEDMPDDLTIPKRTPDRSVFTSVFDSLKGLFCHRQQQTAAEDGREESQTNPPQPLPATVYNPTSHPVDGARSIPGEQAQPAKTQPMPRWSHSMVEPRAEIPLRLASKRLAPEISQSEVLPARESRRFAPMSGAQSDGSRSSSPDGSADVEVTTRRKKKESRPEPEKTVIMGQNLEKCLRKEMERIESSLMHTVNGRLNEFMEMRRASLVDLSERRNRIREKLLKPKRKMLDVCSQTDALPVIREPPKEEKPKHEKKKPTDFHEDEGFAPSVQPSPNVSPLFKEKNGATPEERKKDITSTTAFTLKPAEIPPMSAHVSSAKNLFGNYSKPDERKNEEIKAPDARPFALAVPPPPAQQQSSALGGLFGYNSTPKPEAPKSDAGKTEAAPGPKPVEALFSMGTSGGIKKSESGLFVPHKDEAAPSMLLPLGGKKDEPASSLFGTKLGTSGSILPTPPPQLNPSASSSVSASPENKGPLSPPKTETRSGLSWLTSPPPHPEKTHTPESKQPSAIIVDDDKPKSAQKPEEKKSGLFGANIGSASSMNLFGPPKEFKVPDKEAASPVGTKDTPAATNKPFGSLFGAASAAKTESPLAAPAVIPSGGLFGSLPASTSSSGLGLFGGSKKPFGPGPETETTSPKATISAGGLFGTPTPTPAPRMPSATASPGLSQPPQTAPSVGNLTSFGDLFGNRPGSSPVSPEKKPLFGAASLLSQPSVQPLFGQTPSALPAPVPAPAAPAGLLGPPMLAGGLFGSLPSAAPGPTGLFGSSSSSGNGGFSIPSAPNASNMFQQTVSAPGAFAAPGGLFGGNLGAPPMSTFGALPLSMTPSSVTSVCKRV